MYVCGITPYDATHMGHAATYVAFDLVNRAWRDAGHDVRYVQNVTDIDDPLLERAVERGEDWRAIADRETELFRSDMEALRVLPPAEYIGAVESIPSVVRYVRSLQQRGAVYDVDGDLYFDVHADPTFGDIGGLDEVKEIANSPSAGATPVGPASGIHSTAWSGSQPARMSRPGNPSWGTADPAGTSNAWPSPWIISRRASMSKVEGATSRFHTTRWAQARVTCSPGTPSHGTTSMPAWSAGRGTRCRSPAATSCS